MSNKIQYNTPNKIINFNVPDIEITNKRSISDSISSLKEGINN